MKQRIIRVHDRMQKKYRYLCTEPIGRRFDPEFLPDLTPKQMLALGVFGGKYRPTAKKSFPLIGLHEQSYHQRKKIHVVTFLTLMRVNHYRSGRKKDGSTLMTHADGFSGIAGTIWADEFPGMTNGKSNGGKLSVATLPKYNNTAKFVN